MARLSVSGLVIIAVVVVLGSMPPGDENVGDAPSSALLLLRVDESLEAGAGPGRLVVCSCASQRRVSPRLMSVGAITMIYGGVCFLWKVTLLWRQR